MNIKQYEYLKHLMKENNTQKMLKVTIRNDRLLP